jgi:hypothetical protein
MTHPKPLRVELDGLRGIKIIENEHMPKDGVLFVSPAPRFIPLPRAMPVIPVEDIKKEIFRSFMIDPSMLGSPPMPGHAVLIRDVTDGFPRIADRRGWWKIYRDKYPHRSKKWRIRKKWLKKVMA